MIFLNEKKLGKLIDVQVQKRVIELLPSAVNNVLELKNVTLTPPVGYNPLETIHGLSMEWLYIPWNNGRVLVQVRYPRGVELKEMAGYTQIMVEQSDKTIMDLSIPELVRYCDAIESSAKAALNNPTYDELSKFIFGKDRYLEEIRKQLAEWESMLEGLSGREKWDLQKRIDLANIRLGYALPLNTMMTLSSIACGADVTDIRKITRDILLEAYQKQRIQGGRISDYIPSGVYTTEQQPDIENWAIAVGQEWEKERNKGKKGVKHGR